MRTLALGPILTSMVLIITACSASTEVDPSPAEEITGTIQEAIIAGDPISPEDSGMVHVLTPAGYSCSGTLLTNEWVLTAAHCAVDVANPSANLLRMGSQSSAGAYAVTHPSLDFALIRAATPFRMFGSTTAYRVPLWRANTASLIDQNLLCKGYGCNAYTPGGGCSGAGVLRSAEGMTVTTAVNGDMNFTIRANARGQVLAPGDSGTGCFAPTAQGWALAGVLKSGGLTESYLGAPENWRDWAMAYVNHTAIPLPHNWYAYLLPHPEFLHAPLLDNNHDAYTWNPCPGGHSYTYKPTYDLQFQHDYLTITSGGASRSFTGSGSFTATGMGPITVKIDTDTSVRSAGLLSMPIRCSDLPPIVTLPICIPTAPNQVSWWTADNVFADKRGANPGASVGPVTFGAGKVGPAFQVSPGRFVEVADSASLDVTTSITIEAWVSLSSAASTGRILDKITAGTGDGYLLDVVAGKLRMISGFNVLTAPGALPVGAFVHVAGVYDGATMRLYVAGVQVAAIAATGPIPTNALSARIGADSNANSAFTGLIDELAIYDRALAPAEIAAIQNAGPIGRCK